MANSKNPGEKTRVVLIVVFICLIITATICAVLLSPFAKRITGVGKNDAPIGTTTTEVVSLQTTTTEVTTTILSTESTESESTGIFIPEPTEPDIDPDKNYTFFIDKRVFDYTVADGVTTLTAKDNKNVIISVTPYKTTSYAELCNKTAKLHSKDSEQPPLDIENLYTVYHSDGNGTVTTVYCIDDGIGGSIRLKFERPSDAAEYDKHLEILVSMFSLV